MSPEYKGPFPGFAEGERVEIKVHNGSLPADHPQHIEWFAGVVVRERKQWVKCDDFAGELDDAQYLDIRRIDA